jgi:hypothetical protein
LFLFYQEKRKSPFGGDEPRQDSAKGKNDPYPPVGTFPLKGKGQKTIYRALQYATCYVHHAICSLLPGIGNDGRRSS